ncbi:MAG: hypothetical protein KGL39_57420 [Patescibacteria group bacterium]|nr:hypothetical protein [Patescibacteria group bacterium]
MTDIITEITARRAHEAAQACDDRPAIIIRGASYPPCVDWTIDMEVRKMVDRAGAVLAIGLIAFGLLAIWGMR